MNPSAHNSDKPPFFGTWKAFYYWVVVLLVLQMILFYFFTKAFA
ncbi:MAG: hypothetical protein U0Y10_20560 [Spirosomataceae bacterium]